MAFRPDTSKLSKLAASLRQQPVVLAQKIAAQVAPGVTAKAQQAYSAGQTVYGDARPTGAAGNALTLVQSGATQGSLRFVAIGTRVRVALGTRYAKYLIGKYRILPSGALPVAWRDAIAALARTEIEKGVAA